VFSSFRWCRRRHGCLLSSAKDENVLCEAKTVDKRTLAYKRRERARQSTTDVLIAMLHAAKDIPARFVLFDSWFTLPKTVIRVKKENRDVIGMIRTTEKIHYLYQEKWQNVKSIYQNLESPLDPKTPIIGSVCVKLREDKVSPVDEFVDARIVFIKDRRSENWLALLCTDLSVSEEERLLLLIMTRLISSVDRLTGNDRESVLIFDDSLFSRNRSKKVELLAKVFDHTTHKFFKGFRMLTLGWSDGNTFLPISFNLP